MSHQLRDEVTRIVRNADDRFLKMVQALAKAYDEEIICHTTDGIPLNRVSYIKEVQEAEQEAKAGKVTSTEEVKEQIASWSKRTQ